MKVFTDAKLAGKVFLPDGATGLMEDTVRKMSGRPLLSFSGGVGAPVSTWEEAREFFRRPWPEGREVIRHMEAELLAGRELPRPVTIRRRPRWGGEGELDVDRALAGEESIYREAVRGHHHGPTSVALLLNVGGSHDLTQEKLFWRGAAAAALVDLLEQAGYSCEVWCWCRTSKTFHGTAPHSFTGWKVKAAGDGLDLDGLAKSVSGWFFRTAVIGAWKAQGSRDGSGHPYAFLGHCHEHMGVSEGVVRLEMPVATDRHWALEGARELLDEVTRAGELVS